VHWHRDARDRHAPEVRHQDRHGGWGQEEVKRSVSGSARMPKGEMSELIEMDLELCGRLNVHVPTPEELGYIRGK
jgi:hypothetical protein